MKNGRENSENAVLGILRPIIFGSVAGAFICAVLLAICAWAFVASKHLPQSILQIMVLVIVSISAFFSGFIAAKISHERGFFFGALAGLILYLLFFVCGLIVSNDSITIAALTRLLIMVIIGSIGGIIGVNKKSKTK